jgi:hypothetical protein
VCIPVGSDFTVTKNVEYDTTYCGHADEVNTMTATAQVDTCDTCVCGTTVAAPRVSSATVRFPNPSPNPKPLADGSNVALGCVGVTAICASDIFYVEPASRHWGICVRKAAHGLALGDRASVTGVIRTNPDPANPNDERYIEATSVVKFASELIDPLGLTVHDLGGADWHYVPATGAGQKGIWGSSCLNNIGLLVRVCGQVQTTGQSYVILSDGSGASLKCLLPAGVAPQPGWHTLALTGISTCERDQDGHLLRVLRIRSDDDITVVD